MSTLRSPGDASPAHLSRRPDIPRLTMLRGLGALIVVIGHVALMRPLRTDALNDAVHGFLEPLGIAGVSAFFTLSGFVLTWTIPPNTTARAFWRRRAARLLPVHAITWAFALSILAIGGISGAFWKMLPSLALINVWIPDLEIFWGPNTPSWTLSAEAFFYLLFPLLLTLAWRIRPERLYRTLFAVAALIWLWAAAVALAVPATHLTTDGSEFSRLQYFAVVVIAPARLLDFALGILLARIVIAGRVPGGLRPWAYLTFIAGYIGSRWLIPQPFGFVCAMIPAVIVGVLYAAREDLHGRPSRLATRPLLWVGEISFSLYMVHWGVVFGGYHLLGEPTWTVPEAIVMGLLALGISLGLAHLLHRYIEVPMYRRLRKSRAEHAEAAMRAAPRTTAPAGVDG